MLRKKIILATAFFAGLFQPTFTQSGNIQFRQFNTNSGLADNSVEAILHDSKGFIWFGTHNGLNRFNGAEFEEFRLNPKDANSIPGNFVSNIFEDSNGNIWIGCFGVAKYNYASDSFTRYFYTENDETTISNNITTAFFEDRDGKIYIASPHGIAIYNKKNNNFIRLNTDSYNHKFTCFAQQENSKIWIGTDGGGLFLYDTKNNSFKSVANNLSSCKRIKSLVFTANNTLWIGTWDNGAHVFDTKKLNISKSFTYNKKLPHSIAGNEIATIFRDSKNNIWIGHFNNGLSLYLPEIDGFKTFSPVAYDPYSIQSNSIVAIYQDRFGNLWFGSHGGGLFYFNINTKTFRHYNQIPLKQNWLKYNTISCFAEDDKKQIWLGTDGGGLYSFNPKTEVFKQFNLNDGLNSLSILGLVKYNKNNIYAAGWKETLCIINTQTTTIQNVNSNNKALNNNIKSLSLDKNNNIWLASHDDSGINIYDIAQNTFYNKHNPDIYDTLLLQTAFSSQILHDSKNRVWICSYTGLFMFDRKYNRFNNNPNNALSLSSDYVYSIFEDKNQRLWVATMNGLDLINEHNNNFEFEHFSEKYGLPNNIKSIIDDNSFNLWMATNNKIIKFNPQTKAISTYNVKGNFFERAAFKSNANEIFFGSDNGFYMFNPDSLKTNAALPKVYITELYVNNKIQKKHSNEIGLTQAIIQTNKIELNHTQANIAIKFVAPQFNSNAQNQYKFKLENYDNIWHEAGNDRKAVYSKLPHGNYIFKVQASNSNGIWNENGVQLQIIVHPPFWKNIWFSLLIIFIVAGCIYAIFRIRLASVKRNNIKLKEMVRQRTKEVIKEKEKQQAQESINKELLLKQKELEAENLKTEKELIDLKNKKLEKEIDEIHTDVSRKNAELTASTLQIAYKNELIENFKQQLAELAAEIELKEPKTKINNLIKRLDTTSNLKHEWEKFEVLFNEIHQNFLARLKEKHPDLTSKDLRFCAYVRMNLSSKDIADLLSITAKGVEKSRWRLRQKFNLEQGNDLNHFIQSF